MILLPLLIAAASASPAPADYVERVTQVRLKVGTDGRVKDCVLTKSSGSDELDQQVCKIMTAKAKFQPKLGPDGKAVEFDYSNTVRWRLPKEPAKP